MELRRPLLEEEEEEEARAPIISQKSLRESVVEKMRVGSFLDRVGREGGKGERSVEPRVDELFLKISFCCSFWQRII